MTISVHPQRPRVAVPCGCGLGEAPIWDGRTGTLHWVDIDGQALWSWRPGAHDEASCRPLGYRVSLIQLTPDPDRLIVGVPDGLAGYDLAAETLVPLLVSEPDQPGNRLNDAGVGVDGSIYFGTMDDAEEQPTGGYYRWHAGGLDRFGMPAAVTNGPTLDPDRGCLYTASTPEGRVYRHRLGPDGDPGPAEPFVSFRPGDGKPDGLTVDEAGHVWICHFGGARITRFTPDGEAVLTVPMPTAQVTKVVFAGPDLSTAYVTTAARGRDRETDLLAGHLFSFEAGIRGLAPLLCRMETGPADLESGGSQELAWTKHRATSDGNTI